MNSEHDYKGLLLTCAFVLWEDDRRLEADASEEIFPAANPSIRESLPQFDPSILKPCAQQVHHLSEPIRGLSRQGIQVFGQEKPLIG